MTMPFLPIHSAHLYPPLIERIRHGLLTFVPVLADLLVAALWYAVHSRYLYRFMYFLLAPSHEGNDEKVFVVAVFVIAAAPYLRLAICLVFDLRLFVRVASNGFREHPAGEPA